MLNILSTNFFVDYSLPSVVIAVIVGTLSFFAYKFWGSKIPKTTLSLAQIASSFLLYILYRFIFCDKGFSFDGSEFYTAIFCGSLSIIIFQSIKKISSGKFVPLSATALLIEGLLDGYLSGATLTKTALLIEKIIRSNIEKEQMQKDVVSALKDNVNNFSEQELTHLAVLIITAVSSVDE